jgi:hypothetical protein
VKQSKPSSEEKIERPERNDKRVHVALPVRVTYWDQNKKPALEMGCTYDISPHGARISGLRCIKETGEIVAIERGRNKVFCRVVWIGDPNSVEGGQIGLQSIESERIIFETELRDLENVFEIIPRDENAGSAEVVATTGNRRHLERFRVEGIAEIMKTGRHAAQTAELKDLSELGCLVTTKQPLPPGTDIHLVLNIANCRVGVKGQVKHSALDLGIGVEFSEIRKGDYANLQYLLRKLDEKRLKQVLQMKEVAP